MLLFSMKSLDVKDVWYLFRAELYTNENIQIDNS